MTELTEEMDREAEIRDAVERFNQVTEEIHVRKVEEYQAAVEKVEGLAIVTFRLFNYTTKKVDHMHVEVKVWKTSTPLLLVRKAWKRLRKKYKVPKTFKIPNVLEYSDSALASPSLAYIWRAIPDTRGRYA